MQEPQAACRHKNFCMTLAAMKAQVKDDAYEKQPENTRSVHTYCTSCVDILDKQLELLYV